MTEHNHEPKPAEDPESPGEGSQDAETAPGASPEEAEAAAVPEGADSVGTPGSAETPDYADASEAPEIAASADLGENAHQVVTALLGHQQDLVAELRSVYERLEQVREVDYARLENRVADAEHVVSGGGDVSALVERLTERVDDLTAAANDQSAHTSRLTQQLSEAKESLSAQLADRDARIAAQNARIAELESAITAAAESAEASHQKLQVLAEETESSLIHRVSERVSPAAQQARNALNNIARRLRR